MKLIAFILIVGITVVLILLNKRRKALLKINTPTFGPASSNPDALNNDWLPSPPTVSGGNIARPMPHKNDDEYAFDIVGESNYQPALSEIAGTKEQKNKNVKCKAKIIRERSNQYDPNACAVKINGKKVGYISKADNQRIIADFGEGGFPIEVPALIVGGWKTEVSEGCYGVKLALPANSPPASASDRAMVRYVEGKAVRGLTQRQVKSRLQRWKKEDNDRFYQWEQLSEITELLQSEDGRLEYSIKKPSTKAIMGVFDELIAEGLDVDDLDADELVERLTSVKPELCR